ncbi:unnamed protein product [Cuscuta campestris]|uniref:cytokinin riboside 5'-monophosphate phosphoribohydrolase n=1 Tax=Cuscuta campestris TaxID=132261 RepID=A0A484MPA9_9ASTE|nr:unnamed protein product [Cuscuta campestris]
MEGTSRALSHTIRFVGLLGSHALGNDPRFMAIAVDLGRELVRRKIKLAYGGGSVGLQGAVASTVFTNCGLVRGFIPGYIATRRVYGPTYGVEHTVSSNYYKYFEMNHVVEAFIILPRGVDTMEGLFTLISWASEGLHNRPIGLLNIDGYFNNLIKFLDDAVRQNFMALNQRKLFISSFFVGELLDKLEFAKAFLAFRANYDEKHGHWKSACPYPKVEKYGERERNEKKKKAMVAVESDPAQARMKKPSSAWSAELRSPTMKIGGLYFEEINLKHSSLTEENKLLSEENLKLTEGWKSQLSEITQLKAENESLSEKVKSLNKELGILKSKEAVDKLLETTKHMGREGLGFDPSSSKRKGRTTFIPPKPTTIPNKQKGKEKEKPREVPKKCGCSRHMTGDASLLSNLIPYDGPRVTFGGSNDFGLTNRLGNLVYKGLTIQTVSYVEGLNYNLLSISQFCDKGYSLEFCKDMASLKNISTNEVILTGKRIRNIYEVMWDDVKEACLISKESIHVIFDEKHVVDKPSKPDHEVLDLSDKDEEVNEEDRMKPTEFIPFGSLPQKTSQRNPDSAEPIGNHGQPSNIPDHSHGDNSGSGDQMPIHPETPKNSVLQPEAELDQPVNPNQHNLRWLRDHPPQKVIGDIQSGIRTRSAQQNLEAMLACKKYDARYWLYYLSSKEENRACSTAEDEGSSDNVLIVSLKKSLKRKQVVSPSPSAEAPHNLAVDNLVEKEQIEEVFTLKQSPQQLDEEIPQNQSFPSPSSQAQTDDEVSKFMQLYYDWRAWKENAATPQQEQNQETSEEELQQLLQSQVQEILTTSCEISKPTEPKVPEKSTENLEKSPLPETTEEEALEEQVVEVLRSFKEAEEGAQIARMEAFEPPVAIFEQQAADEVRDSLSREISNYANEETEEESVKTLKIDEEDSESHCNQAADCHSQSQPSEADVTPSDGYQVSLGSVISKPGANSRRHFGTYTGKHKLEVIVQPRSPSQITKFPIDVKQGELSYIPSHLNMTELILEAQQSNPENSIQHLSNTEFDGTEAVGTIASHFTNDAQTEERYNNLERIQEECGVMQGIGEVAGSSKSKKK